MEQDKMRDEFEAWHREKYPEQDVRKQNLLGTYTFIIVEQRWECWQASRAAVVMELPEEDKAGFGGADGPLGPSTEQIEAAGYNCGVKACRSAIHAAGIRTR